MKFNFKTLLYGVGLLGILALASPSVMAAEFNDFQFDPDYDGDTTDAITADKIEGNYVEVITFTATTLTTGTFNVKLRWQPGQFVAADGSSPIPGGISGLGSDYLLYALYEGQGTYQINSDGTTTFVTTVDVGSFSLYLTEDVVLSLFANTGNAVTFANIFDLAAGVDPGTLLGSGVPQAGEGTLDPSLSTCDPGINCGSFGTSTTLVLTADGSTFFIDPVPFYNLSFQSGQLNNFDVGSGDQIINGSLDAVFANVPEPATLTLMGLALAGLGLTLRRRRLT